MVPNRWGKRLTALFKDLKSPQIRENNNKQQPWAISVGIQLFVIGLQWRPQVVKNCNLTSLNDIEYQILKLLSFEMTIQLMKQVNKLISPLFKTV